MSCMLYVLFINSIGILKYLVYFRHRVSESSESTSTTNSTTTPSATPEIPLNMSSNDQEYHPGDYDNDNADSPTWRGILRKTNSKINLND